MLNIFKAEKQEPTLNKGLSDILGSFTKTLQDIKDFRTRTESDIAFKNKQIDTLSAAVTHQTTELKQAAHVENKINELLGE